MPPSTLPSGQVVNPHSAEPVHRTGTWGLEMGRAVRMLCSRPFQWVFGIALLCYVAMSHWPELQSFQWGRLGMSQCVLVIACALCSQIAMSLRWRCLIPHLQTSFSAVDACRLGFIGTLSQYSPLGHYGGMTFRSTVLIAQQHAQTPHAILSVVLDRVVGLFCLVVVSGLAILVMAYQSAFHIPQALFVCHGALAACLLVAVLIHLAFRNTAVKQVAWLSRLSHQYVSAPSLLLLKNNRCVARSVIWGLVSQLATVGATALLAFTFAEGKAVPGFIEHAAVLPLVELSALALPTPAGIGVREFVLSHIYETCGPAGGSAPGKLAIAVAMGLRLATFIATSLGIACVSVLRMNSPTSAQPPAN